MIFSYKTFEGVYMTSIYSVGSLAVDVTDFFKEGQEIVGDIAGHVIYFFHNLPQQMQRNRNIAIAVILTTNTLFFYTINKLVNYLDPDAAVQQAAAKDNARKYKNLLSDAVVSFLQLTFNVGLSKITGFNLNRSWLAGITVAAFALRIFFRTQSVVEIREQQLELAEEESEEANDVKKQEETPKSANPTAKVKDKSTSGEIDIIESEAKSGESELEAKSGESEIKNKTVNSVSNDTFILSHEGEDLARQGKYDEAIIKFEAVLKLDPNNVLTLNRCGLVLRLQSKYDEAIAKFEVVLKLEPNNVDALMICGNILMEQDKHDKAIAKFETILKLEPDHVGALISYGLALMNQTYDKAIAKFEAVLKLEPNNEMALHMYGLSLMGQGKYEEAIVKFEAVLKLNPDHVSALMDCGLALMNQDKYDKAIVKLEAALKLEPNNENALRDYDKARKKLEEKSMHV